jgi:hypothetical protein
MNINQKIYFSIAAIALLGIVLTVFQIYPAFRAIQKNSEELLLERNKISSLSRQTQEQERGTALYRTYQESFKMIENAFIDPDIPVEFIRFLEKVAFDTNIQLTITSVTRKVMKEDPWPSLQFQISLEGFPADFLKFLEKIELSPYLTEVLDLTLKDKTANMTIKVYTK